MSNTDPGALTRWSCFRNRLTMSGPFRLFQMQRAERSAPDSSPCPAGKNRSVYKTSMSIRTLKMQAATNPHYRPARLLVQRIPVSRPALPPSVHSGAPLLSGLPCRSTRLFAEAGTLYRPDRPVPARSGTADKVSLATVSPKVRFSRTCLPQSFRYTVPLKEKTARCVTPTA